MRIVPQPDGFKLELEKGERLTVTFPDGPPRTRVELNPPSGEVVLWSHGKPIDGFIVREGTPE